MKVSPAAISGIIDRLEANGAEYFRLIISSLFVEGNI